MLFITNRELKGKKEKLSFVASNKVSNDLRYCEINYKLNDKDKDFAEIGSNNLMKKLRDNHKTEIMFYIHGFNNQPFSDIFVNAEKMQNQLTNNGIKHIEIVPLIWPCDNDFGIIKDYMDDQETAKISGAFFSRAISKLLKWQENNMAENKQCIKRMHMFSHSMGNLVLQEAMNYWAKNYGNGDVPFLFKNIFLVAADIPNENLERKEDGYLITQAGKFIFSYFAYDDLAMPASKILNTRKLVFSRRLGHTGPENMNAVTNNVYAVDCSNFNNVFDKKGHTYFIDKNNKESPAFKHICKVLNKDKSVFKQRIIEL